ncbi:MULTISPECIES: DUF2264 domain-containing protein [unclassified Anabaena]|uniref:DUF2264 domain-containing protein n=1 Tax=unclassified Anabaena TaxID=2619674 RepID=UPI00144541D9|nr:MULTISPECIES: DUF2264 domain-containing protein [unclassified Anabaena]MTJ06632.1 DUF2264 domain-containing protein [Anabaena sp. UHCC 0204]MTJ54404.1 DUF2264 domain-containing protein [Anabaena sp. UHCC 0253]
MNLFTGKAIKWIVIFIITALCVVMIRVKLEDLSRKQTEGWTQTSQPFPGYEEIDAKIKTTFINENQSPFLRYKALFEYFTLGFIKYRSPHGALIYYPGAASSHGRKVDALEGFARFFPLAAVWMSSGHGNIVDINNEKIDLIQILHQGIVAGTDLQNTEYWGQMKNRDQRIVEAADIALGLWISRNHLWTTFSPQERQQIVTWLEQVMDQKLHDNNWYLFPIIIQKSLESLGVSNNKYDKLIEDLYQDYKQRYYIGEGWFNDPPKGVDYYNAWAIHYSLFWLDQIDPQFDPIFIRKTHAEFLKFYRYFFSKNGFPSMGRSICYRMAAPAPIVTGTMLAPKEISPGFALGALDLTWRFFVEKNSLQKGTVTQGYFTPDLSIIDSYSGPGSCLWSLRSLIVAFYVDKFIPLWNSSPEKLPIEVADFSEVNKSIGWRIKGDKLTQNIELELLKNQGNKFTKIKQYGIFNQIKEFIAKRPFRPQNYEALYRRPSYSTASPVSNPQKDNI